MTTFTFNSVDMLTKNKIDNKSVGQREYVHTILAASLSSLYLLYIISFSLICKKDSLILDWVEI